MMNKITPFLHENKQIMYIYILQLVVFEEE